MITKTKKFLITFLKKTARDSSSPTFFQLARKNITKKKKLANSNLSKNVDKIAYGV